MLAIFKDGQVGVVVAQGENPVKPIMTENLKRLWYTFYSRNGAIFTVHRDEFVTSEDEVSA